MVSYTVDIIAYTGITETLTDFLTFEVKAVGAAESATLNTD